MSPNKIKRAQNRLANALEEYAREWPQLAEEHQNAAQAAVDATHPAFLQGLDGSVDVSLETQVEEAVAGRSLRVFRDSAAFRAFVPYAWMTVQDYARRDDASPAVLGMLGASMETNEELADSVHCAAQIALFMRALGRVGGRSHANEWENDLEEVVVPIASEMWERHRHGWRKPALEKFRQEHEELATSCIKKLAAMATADADALAAEFEMGAAA